MRVFNFLYYVCFRYIILQSVAPSNKCCLLLNRQSPKNRANNVSLENWHRKRVADRLNVACSHLEYLVKWSLQHFSSNIQFMSSNVETNYIHKA